MQAAGNDPSAAATVSIPDELVAKFKKFKLGGKNQENCVFQMKINAKTLELVIENEESGVSIDDVAEDLPEMAPRYIAYSYKWTHKDGRTSFPLVLIYYCPPGGPTQSNILYSSSKPLLQKQLNVQKVFDLQRKSDLDEEWLQKKLNLYN